MKALTAKQRFTRRHWTSLALYALLIVPVLWAHWSGRLPTGPTGYALAAAATLPLFGVIWAMLRYVTEIEDEYLRLLEVRATLGGTGLTLAICTVWGGLALLVGAPQGSLLYVFPIFVFACDAARAWTHWRAR